MPEGPEVYITTVKLRNKLLNQQLISIHFLTDKYKTAINLYNSYLVQFLAYPSIITNVFCKAKYIFLELSNSCGSVYLHSHLSMTGRFSWIETRFTKIKFNFSSFSVFFDDVRNFGQFEIYNQEDLRKVLNNIGPDLLAEPLSLNDWWNFLTKHGKSIKCNITVALLDQTCLSGIGNYLKSEILYYSRINPFKSLQELSNEQIHALYYYSYAIPRLSVQAGGLTISDFKDPDNLNGTFNKVVYKEKKDPNGFEVISVKTPDGRSTFWVPQVQN